MMISWNRDSYETDHSFSDNSYDTQGSFFSQNDSISEKTPTEFSDVFNAAASNSPLKSERKFQTTRTKGRRTPVPSRSFSADESSQTPKRSSRPALSFSQLIRDELMKHEGLTTNELCELLSQKYPLNFPMNEKRWKASVRNCLSNKDDFVKVDVAKVQSMKGKHIWKLSDSVMSKLNSPRHLKADFFKENSQPLDWNIGKYRSIAPKPRFMSSISLDGYSSTSVLDVNETSNDSSQMTPLRPMGSSIWNRDCFSEDKNLHRRRTILDHGTKTTLKVGAKRRNTVSVAPKKKLFIESQVTPQERVGAFREKLESDETYHIRIKGSESIVHSTPVREARFHSNATLKEDQNAVFNESCCKTTELEDNAPTSFAELKTYITEEKSEFVKELPKHPWLGATTINDAMPAFGCNNARRIENDNEDKDLQDILNELKKVEHFDSINDFIKSPLTGFPNFEDF